MYRLVFIGEALAGQGHDVVVDYDHTYQAIFQPSVFGDRIIGLADDVDADVVVLQRPLRRERYELLQALQAKGVAVVVEIDDDFHAVHRRNPAWAGTNPLTDTERNRDWLMKACKAADLVTVTTPALADRYGAHGRVAVLPNYVPEKYLTREPGPYTDEHLERLTGTVAGWTGSIVTHPDDLEATAGGIPDALEETGAKFHVVGTGVGVSEALGLRRPVSATGWLPIEAYPEAIRQLDVGIVPLASHQFNQAKSWLKGLEFASLGVPFVATPTGPYVELHEQHGLGFLAEGRDGWRELTHQLLADHVLREEESIRHREIAAGLTVEANAWRWMEAWEQALANRHGRVAA
jgi:glycosyltransferase involved in cell wall biosynthesis